MNFFSELKFEWINLGISLCAMLIVYPLFYYLYFKKRKVARVRFSSLRNIKKIKPSLKIRLRHSAFYLRLLTLLALFLAFSHPYLEREKKQPEEAKEEKSEKEDKKEQERKKIKTPTEGISIQLVVDRSGSMGLQEDPFRGKFGYIKFEDELMSKLDVVKIISKRFVKGNKKLNATKDSAFEGRGNDMIGLMPFARFPLIACPLTLRHDLMLDYISQMDVVKLQEENGTYIGYSLQRSILQIIDARSRAKKNSSYNIKSSIIVMITDGEQFLHPEDEDDPNRSLLPTEAAELAKEHGIKIYTIAIAPRQVYTENGSALPVRSYSVDEIRKAAEMSGGRFYSAENGNALLDVYKQINELEKSALPVKKELEVKVEKSKEITKKEVERIEFFEAFLFFALFTFVAEILLNEVYFVRIP